MADGNYSGVYGQVGKCQSSSQDINQTKEDRSFSRLNKKTGPQICTSRDTLNDIIDALLICKLKIRPLIVTVLKSLYQKKNRCPKLGGGVGGGGGGGQTFFKGLHIDYTKV